MFRRLVSDQSDQSKQNHHQGALWYTERGWENFGLLLFNNIPGFKVVTASNIKVTWASSDGVQVAGTVNKRRGR